MAGLNTTLNNRKRLSSLLTIFYKFFVPVIFVGFLILLNYLLKDIATSEDLIGINVSYVVILIIGCLPTLNIKKVFCDSKSLYVSNYFTEKEYKLESVVSIKRWFIFFFRIRIEENGKRSKIKYMPRESGNISFLFRKPDSIIEFERLIQRQK